MTGSGRPLPLPPAALRQPDRFTCGPTATLAARLLLDPEYAAMVPPDRVAPEVHALHRRLTGPRDAAGRPQPPWPRWLGTPPWAVARELSHRSGRRYRVRLLRWGARSRADAVLAAATTGPVPLFVGSRWLPRHVLVVVATADDAPGAALTALDPAAGRLVTLPVAELAAGGLRSGRWRRPWFAVLPG